MKYTEEHEWLRVEGDIVVVGVTEYAVTQLGDLVFVELPDVGRQVSRDEDIVVIESVKAASDILARWTAKSSRLTRPSSKTRRW